MSTDVSFDDLEQALHWVSSSDLEAGAVVSLATGKVYLRGADGPIDDDFPEDWDDNSQYISVPHKNDLNLGSRLAMRFAAEHTPHLHDRVREAFRRKGAYSRFKGLLDGQGLLDVWFEYERQAVRLSLEEWASESGLVVRHAGDT